MPQQSTLPPAPPFSAPPVPQQVQRTSVLAILALIFGILGFAPPFLIASVACGILARKEIDRSGGAVGGRGMATAGLVFSGIWAALIVIGIIAAVVIPLLLGARTSAEPAAGPFAPQSISAPAEPETGLAMVAGDATCASHMTALWAAINVYSMENSDQLPATLDALAALASPGADILTCPAMAAAGASDPSGVDYSYNPQATLGDRVPLIWDAAAAHGPSNARTATVLFANGDVELVTPEALNAMLSP